ncbi:MAG: hypothetical protein AAGJ88_16655, partial [Pseudomonadota bacterium]
FHELLPYINLKFCCRTFDGSTDRMLLKGEYRHERFLFIFGVHDLKQVKMRSIPLWVRHSEEIV